MRSLSKKKHEALIEALRALEEWSDNNPVVHENGIQEDIRQLQILFARYEELISELGDCISAYQTMHKRLRIDVLAPQFRIIRNRIDQRSLEYHRLKKCFVAVRSC